MTSSKVCSTCGKVENPVCSNSFHLPAYQSALQAQTVTRDTPLKRLLADVRWALFQAGNCDGLCGECRERVEEVLLRVQSAEDAPTACGLCRGRGRVNRNRISEDSIPCPACSAPAVTAKPDHEQFEAWCVEYFGKKPNEVRFDSERGPFIMGDLIAAFLAGSKCVSRPGDSKDG